MQLSYHLIIKECPEARRILEHAGYRVSPVDEKIHFFPIDITEKQRNELPELIPYILPLELVSKKYAKDEKRAARWLTIEAAWQQYEIANKEAAIYRPCKSCFCNRKQIDTYKINAPIKKARKAFLTPPGENVLLVRDDVRELLDHSDMRGFHFHEIICGYKDSALQRFSQMVVENTLPPAVLYDEADYRHKYVCESCGTHYAIMKGSAIIKIDRTVMEKATEDIYFSYEQFGATGFSRKKIISGRFYRLLEENGFANDIIVDDVVKLV